MNRDIVSLPGGDFAVVQDNPFAGAPTLDPATNPFKVYYRRVTGSRCLLCDAPHGEQHEPTCKLRHP